jgi:hypothetical protein
VQKLTVVDGASPKQEEESSDEGDSDDEAIFTAREKRDGEINAALNALSKQSLVAARQRLTQPAAAKGSATKSSSKGSGGKKGR